LKDFQRQDGSQSPWPGTCSGDINDKVDVDCTKRSAVEALDEGIFAGVPDFVLLIHSDE
jgi:hypothetical protein